MASRAMKERAAKHEPFSAAELDGVLASLQRAAAAAAAASSSVEDGEGGGSSSSSSSSSSTGGGGGGGGAAPIDWATLRALLGKAAHLSHKDWVRTESAADSLGDVLGGPANASFRDTFHRVLEDGKWDSAAAAPAAAPAAAGAKKKGAARGGRTERPAAVPPPPKGSPCRAVREALPVFGYRAQLIAAINDHPVVVVEGDTGCGKTTQVPQPTLTTHPNLSPDPDPSPNPNLNPNPHPNPHQVPQFVLEEAAARGMPCSIVCTQPRRISAVGVAERVAAERGEVVGGAIGYAIRLESKSSANTALLFCTSGILIRHRK